MSGKDAPATLSAIYFELKDADGFDNGPRWAKFQYSGDFLEVLQKLLAVPEAGGFSRRIGIFYDLTKVQHEVCEDCTVEESAFVIQGEHFFYLCHIEGVSSEIVSCELTMDEFLAGVRCAYMDHENCKDRMRWVWHGDNASLLIAQGNVNAFVAKLTADGQLAEHSAKTA